LLGSSTLLVCVWLLTLLKTNHLDAAARRWLGEYVGGYEGTVLLVSHDEAMVRRAVSSIAEVRDD